MPASLDGSPVEPHVCAPGRVGTVAASPALEHCCCSAKTETGTLALLLPLPWAGRWSARAAAAPLRSVPAQRAQHEVQGVGCGSARAATAPFTSLPAQRAHHAGLGFKV